MRLSGGRSSNAIALEGARRNAYFLPVVARLTVAIFAFVVYSPSALAVFRLAQAAAAQSAPQPKSARQALAMSLHDLQQMTQRGVEDGGASSRRRASRSEIRPILEMRSRLLAMHAAAGEEFDAERARLAASDLPGKLLARHDAVRARVEAGFATLIGLIERLDTAPTPSERWNALVALKEFLARFSFTTRHQKLDPDKLPRREAEPTQRKPRTRKDQFSQSEPAPPAGPVHLAFNGDLSALMLAQGGGTPELDPTPDAPHTPGIVDLAASLGNNPAAIFDWVRTKVHFVPTFGSLQGAEGCRLSRECNAHDTASLLIALLRVSGIPARYVEGTVNVDPALFMSVMGDFTDIDAATTLAASGGIPVTGLFGPEGLEAVQVESVWVEAQVDYVPSRGAKPGAGGTWVPLDACLKPSEFTPPMNVESAIGTDFQTYVDSLQNTAVQSADGLSATGMDQNLSNASLEGFVDDLNASIATSMPDATVADVVGAVTITAKPLEAIPATLPAEVVVAGATRNELAASVRHRVTLRIAEVDFLGFENVLVTNSWDTVAIADKRVTIGYVPATEADQLLVENSGGLYNAPPGSLSVRPTIFVDGEAVAQGPAVGMGTDQKIRVTFFEPGAGSDSVEHTVPAGSWAALGLDLQSVSAEALADRQARFDQTRQQIAAWGEDPAAAPVGDQVGWDEIIGEMLHLHAMSYFIEVEANNKVAENASNVVSIKRPAEMLATFRPTVVYGLFGNPVDIGNLGMGVDVQRYIVSTESRTGDNDAARDYNFVTGAFGSAMEHKVFEALQRDHTDPLDDLEAVSTVKLLAEANRLGMPVYQVTPDNLSQVLAQLTVDSSIRSDVSAAVNGGKHVVIHRDPITVQQWTGVGYAVIDPANGTGAWLISGGLAGGATGENSTWGEFIADLTGWLTYAANASGFILPALQASSKFLTGTGALDFLGNASKWAGRAGIVVAVLSAIVTFWSVFQDPNGGFWEGLLAGGADALGSLLIALLVAKLVAAFAAGAGILALLGWLVLIILLTALIIYLVGLLAAWLTSALLPPDRRERMFARRAPRYPGLLALLWRLLRPDRAAAAQSAPALAA